MISLLIVLFFHNAPASEIQMPLLPDKDIYHNCINCHRTKNMQFVPNKHQPQRIHQNIHLQHGNKEMSCNFCHDKNNHNFLRRDEGEQTEFRAPSGVCAQCHSEEYKSWNSGTHGKRIGGWNGTRTQLQCTECHNPHSVKFPLMKAAPAPHKPKFLILKSTEHE